MGWTLRVRAGSFATAPVERWVLIDTLCPQTKKSPKGAFLDWRRGWDSNPRRATNPCWFSRPVHSTALPPLQTVLSIQMDQRFGSDRCGPCPSGALASFVRPKSFPANCLTAPLPLQLCTSNAAAHFARYGIAFQPKARPSLICRPGAIISARTIAIRRGLK